MLYVAYGSNLNKNQMMKRCPGAIPVGSGIIKGYELNFRRSFLTIEKKEGAEVPVGIWEINSLHEKSLDKYEGYPVFYHKQTITVETDTDIKVGLVYVMDDKWDYYPPTPSYVKTCLEGYRDFNLDEKYLKEALDRCEEYL